MIIHRSALLLLCLLAAGASARALAAGAPVLGCAAATPTVGLGGAVVLSAWAPGSSPRYVWEAPVGRLEGHGQQTRWDLGGLRPGTYAAVVRVGDPSGASECVVRVIVRQDAGTRGGGTATPRRETGSALLLEGARETDGYGLYSYLLLGAPPSAEARERYLKAVEAVWTVLPDIKALEQYLPRAELNVAYVPVRSAPGEGVSAQWILDNYDYARARSLLRYLPGSNRDGPYLLSTLTPLGAASAPTAGPRLFQDLSRVPPHLAASWVKAFLDQAAQERFWDERSGAKLALELRVTVAILGEGLPEVKKALDSWIAWAR
jgi:hypothetical protein